MASTIEAIGNVSNKIGRKRWTICALLFFATTINYIDRGVFGFLGPDLQRSLGWSETEYANIVAAFTTAYAIGLVIVGSLMDRFGTRKGFAGAVVFWSLAAMGHAFASTAFGFGIARFFLGLGEAGNFPASIKTVAEWFPKKERALVTGIFNAGSNMGPILVPLTIPIIVFYSGWQGAFIVTGALGFIWLVLWLIFYRKPEEHSTLSPGELAYIQSDPIESVEKIPWLKLLPHRQTWAFAIGKFLTDPIWWFYLFWLTKFLDKNYGISMSKVTIPVIVIYVVADVGSIGGGWLSSFLIKRGWSVNAGRKTAMLVCALAVVPVIFATMTTNLWLTVALIALATAAHQGWSANIFTTASDMFPRRAVGSVVGIGGTMGAIGGVLFQMATGWILQWNGSNYIPIFIVCGSVYLIALLVIHLLAPKLEPARIDSSEVLA
jgi:ACS family hexuronate transporter-like MFS transporter